MPTFFKVLWNLLASLMLLIIVVTVLVTLFNQFPFEVSIVVANCDKDSCNDTDAIALAYQLGRLDFISAILAIATIFLGAFSIYGFWNIQRNTKAIAVAEVEKYVSGDAEQIIQQKVDAIANDYFSSMNSADKTDSEENEEDWGDHL